MNRSTTRTLAVAACLLALASAPGLAAADDLDHALSRAKKKLVSQLQSVNKWAAGKRISGFRHRTFELILRIDPDDSRARGVLGYKRKGKDGPWVRKKQVEEPPDWAAGLLPKAEARITKALTRYRENVLAALDTDPDPKPERHETVLETLVDLLPDDATLRERCGDVEYKGRWLLPESVTAIKRRKELRRLAVDVGKKAFLAAEEDPGPRARGWKTAWKSADRFVYGVVDDHEGRDILTAMEAAEELCTVLLGASEKPLSPTETIVLTSRDQARQILRRETKWKTALAEVDMVSGLHLPSGEYMVYRSDEKNRRMGPVRQVIDSGLKRRFEGKTRGWITEGLGQRLTFYVSGLHGPGLVSLNRTERLTSDEEADSLPAAPRDWPHAAARILTRDGPARVANLLTKRLNAMTVADVLVAYGLAAYLIETRPKAFLRFTEATAAGHDAEEIIRTKLGADDAAMLTRRLRRWLKEY